MPCPTGRCTKGAACADCLGLHPTVEVPRPLLSRLLAAIETPDDLTDLERTELLEDAYAATPGV